MIETIEKIDPRLQETLLYYGRFRNAKEHLIRLIAVHGMSTVNAQQLIVDEMKRGNILLTDSLEVDIND